MPLFPVNAQTPLKISTDERFLVDSIGNPFFWLGDTALGLFYHTTHETAEEYLTIRKNQGFNIIQGEPANEDKINYQLSDRIFKSQPYWSFLAGAKGHTYGKSYIAYYTDDRHPHDRREWESLADSLDTPGVKWLQIFKESLSELTWWELITDNEWILGYPGEGNRFMAAACTRDQSTVVIYFPENKTSEIKVPQHQDKILTVYWVDTVDGENIAVDLTGGRESFPITPPDHFSDGLLNITNG
jgi:hypothetical protein